MVQTLPKRDDIFIQDRWDTASIFPSDEAWEEALGQARNQLEGLALFKGRLAEGPAKIVAWQEAAAATMKLVGKIFVYASMGYSVEVTNQAAIARFDRGRGLFNQAMAAMAFAEPEMVAIGFDTLQKWMEEEPALAVYAHYFDELARKQAHLRSPEVEMLLRQVGDAFSSATGIHGVLADADMRFAPAGADPDSPPIEIGAGNINALLASANRDLRQAAFENYADAFLAHKNTMAACIATGVKQHLFTMRAKNYKSCLEAALKPNHIPVDIFHNTIHTFRQHLPTWHKYWRVRRKALGYDQLHVYDIKAPLTSQSPAIPYEQAVDWICQGMAPLGEDYVALMRQGLTEQRWVDKYPNAGKRTGAFSTGIPGTHPFIFMSYNDDVFGLSTLAHEIGHSMHSYLTWANQPMVYARYSLFVAEVASNFNQALVRNYLLTHHSDRNFQIALLEEAMSNYHRYFFIMPTLARFELEIHERLERGQALTAAGLIELMADLFREGYGDEVVFDAERIGITWGQFATHLYSNFYVYQYTTGIAGANALTHRVASGEAGAVENYLAFLKAGASMYPLEALQMAGVDMASPEPVERAFAVLAGYVDRLEALLA